jgi:hypothetical protein
LGRIIFTKRRENHGDWRVRGRYRGALGVMVSLRKEQRSTSHLTYEVMMGCVTREALQAKVVPALRLDANGMRWALTSCFGLSGHGSMNNKVSAQ